MATPDPALDDNAPEELDESQWQTLLRPEEFQILRHSATERAFTGPHLQESRAGAYHCVGCGQRLYDAKHKFHSGCGWPSFFQAVEPGALTVHEDTTLGMVRTEMRCGRCDGHLGHIFPDAPNQPTGLRHCVNGLALVFVPEGEDPRECIRRHREGAQGMP